MWICTFASAFFGRPRERVTVPRAGRTTSPPTAISARSNCSCVHSGASSGSTQPRRVARFFTGIALPHRNHMAILATRGPHHHDEPLTKQAVGLKPGLTIVVPVVQQRESGPGKYLRGVLKIQTPLSQRSLSLGGIVRDRHGIYMPTENWFVKEFGSSIEYIASALSYSSAAY